MENIIKCPYCEAEYVASEIYMPNDFLGKPKNIYKDIDGKIDLVDDEQHLEEIYCCDKCNKVFKVKAVIEYITSKKEELNFNDGYSTPLYGDRITLEE